MENTPAISETGMFFDQEKEALIASGMAHDEIAVHTARLDTIFHDFIQAFGNSDDRLTMAKGLFDYLWDEKPHRYEQGGHFRLNNIIDNHLDPDSIEVGNCLGLTLLYNCLLMRSGITARAIFIENAFESGPHVLSYLFLDGRSVDVENILSEGFDFKGHLDDPTRTMWDGKELVADIYLSMGNECFQTGRETEALRLYEKALSLNPEYERAVINRAIVMDKLKRKAHEEE